MVMSTFFWGGGGGGGWENDDTVAKLNNPWIALPFNLNHVNPQQYYCIFFYPIRVEKSLDLSLDPHHVALLEASWSASTVFF